MMNKEKDLIKMAQAAKELVKMVEKLAGDRITKLGSKVIEVEAKPEEGEIEVEVEPAETHIKEQEEGLESEEEPKNIMKEKTKEKMRPVIQSMARELFK